MISCAFYIPTCVCFVATCLPKKESETFKPVGLWFYKLLLFVFAFPSETVQGAAYFSNSPRAKPGNSECHLPVSHRGIEADRL